VKPKIGDRIYDGAAGSAGFLCESFDYLKAKPGLTTKDAIALQHRTFYGKEKKSLAYVIAIMNMILHGIEAPNIIHTNTLTENLADIQDKDRFDVVLANPPFGGKERKEVQQNFPIRSGETAFLFLQHFIKILKAGGRGGVVIKNTFLSNTDNASVRPGWGRSRDGERGRDGACAGMGRAPGSAPHSGGVASLNPRLIAATPPGSTRGCGIGVGGRFPVGHAASGGVASLDPRLIAATPPGSAGAGGTDSEVSLRPTVDELL
jgi:hypothetical protein